ncbi:YihY/virulence factor BrkB family protein [Planomonospora venezuelensis]|uniref:Membrane protein n=1 Tax=Planomonospora venezuelensis TaxID=1999 RepID=A0A841CWG9_PLAVE|nr:YihY/virulence factor BrkB family protein [Planomonospora venezuelensis]MBB5962261.1 membrane protein [Planomonospora venezuelensis]GIN01027.1 inner membrane protein YhjD [Planomonospora venezuelensis]
MAGLGERIRAFRDWGRGRIETDRVRWHWFDHLLRTVQRYQLQFGDRLAGAVSYFAFLSFFPIIVLAFAVFGFFLSSQANADDTLREAINDYLPGLAAKLPIDEIAKARTAAGVIGLVGLLYSGLGAIDALRGALRQMSMTTEPPLNLVLGKLRDLSALILVGVTMIVSVVVGGFATQASTTVAGWLGLSTSFLGAGTIWLAGMAVSVAADTVVFVILLGWLGRSTQPFRVVVRGALLGAVVFTLLKQLAAFLLSFTLGNPIYGAFAVMVGLLVWINLSARVIMYAAAWTATASFGPPPEPTPVPGAGNALGESPPGAPEGA